MTPPDMIATIPGKPIGKARPRVTQRGTYMPREYRSWMLVAVPVLRMAWRGKPKLEAARVEVEAVMSRPAKPPRHCRARGDVDNLAGSVLDACSQAGVWVDDGRVVRLEAWKRYAEPGESVGCVVRVWELG